MRTIFILIFLSSCATFIKEQDTTTAPNVSTVAPVDVAVDMSPPPIKNMSPLYPILVYIGIVGGVLLIGYKRKWL